MFYSDAPLGATRVDQPSATALTLDDDTILDETRLRSFTADDPALEAELAALYLETAHLYLARLRDSLDDAVTWQRAAHALKGASANIGAVVVARLAAGYEQGEPEIGAIRRLEGEIAAVRACFRARGTLATD